MLIIQVPMGGKGRRVAFHNPSKVIKGKGREREEEEGEREGKGRGEREGMWNAEIARIFM